jgi:hypothetical protein
MAKKPAARKPKGNLVEQIDAAIALLSHVRTMAASEGPRSRAVRQTSTKKTNRVLSENAREAIAAAQRKRWAKVRRQKKQAARAVLA